MVDNQCRHRLKFAREGTGAVAGAHRRAVGASPQQTVFVRRLGIRCSAAATRTVGYKKLARGREDCSFSVVVQQKSSVPRARCSRRRPAAGTAPRRRTAARAAHIAVAAPRARGLGAPMGPASGGGLLVRVVVVQAHVQAVPVFKLEIVKLVWRGQKANMEYDSLITVTRAPARSAGFQPTS